MSKIDIELQNIYENGFSLDDLENRGLILAFLSLGIAIKSWFSTYSCQRWRLKQIDPNSSIALPNDSEINPKDFKAFYILHNYTWQYFKAYSEVILHFNHFFELFFKEILRKENELFVTQVQDAELLSKLIKGENISENLLIKEKSIDYNVVLTRFLTLLRSGVLDNSLFNFVNENEPVLRKLNLLRNRLIHRGTYVLHYSALDMFIGRFIIPLTFNILNLHEYKNREKYWKYQLLSCGIDPLEQIITEYENINPKKLKIAYLKELGRAAYENPIQRRLSLIDDGSKSRAELLASFELKDENSGIYDIKSCPVCGALSLIRFYDSDQGNDEILEKGKYTLFVNRVKCRCCSFEVTNELGDTQDLDLPLDNYWLEQEVCL